MFDNGPLYIATLIGEAYAHCITEGYHCPGMTWADLEDLFLYNEQVGYLFAEYLENLMPNYLSFKFRALDLFLRLPGGLFKVFVLCCLIDCFRVFFSAPNSRRCDYVWSLRFSQRALFCSFADFAKPELASYCIDDAKRNV
jgi:hypothetical protein